MSVKRAVCPWTLFGAAAMTGLSWSVAPETAEAAGPAVVYAENTTALDSSSQKTMMAVCPAGWWIVGGAGNVLWGEGQVAIQAAFPFVEGVVSGFVVKAVEDVTGTPDAWSLQASAYCVDVTVATIVSESSAFDSSPIKSATVMCPDGLQVVGMGAEVSTTAVAPGSTLAMTPSTSVVLQGIEADPGLTTVTARASEQAGALGGSFAGSWQVSAVAACAAPPYFEGLELVQTTWHNLDVRNRIDLFCSSKDKRVIAMGAKVEAHDMGNWYLDAFRRYNAFQSNRIVAEAFWNPELGTLWADHTAYGICVDR